MDLLSSQDLVRLADGRGGSRLSLFLPTHRGGPQTAMNRIRLKNLVRLARGALEEGGIAPAVIDSTLQPARRFIDDGWSLRQPGDGLAVFLGPEKFETFRVPLRLPELVTVGERFFVRPLLPLLVAGGHFFLLALSQDVLRLYRGGRFRLEEVELDGLPLDMWLTVPRRRQRVNAFLADRGGSGQRTVYFGGAEPDDKQLVFRYFQRVDRALRDLLGVQQTPLVLAGVRSVQALYRRANTCPQLLPDGSDGSPLTLTAADLHQQVWPLVEPALRAQEAMAVSTYQALEGTGRTSDELETILAAAEQGRVQDLFLSSGAGTAAATATAPRLVTLTAPPGRDDQLDLAAVATLRAGGSVHALSATRVPGGGPVAATLRY